MYSEYSVEYYNMWAEFMKTFLKAGKAFFFCFFVLSGASFMTVFLCYFNLFCFCQIQSDMEVILWLSVGLNVTVLK